MRRAFAFAAIIIIVSQPLDRARGDAAPRKRPPAPSIAPTSLDARATVAYALVHAPTLLAQRATIANLDSQFQKARAAEFPLASGQLQNQIQRSHNESGQFAQFGIAPTSNFSQNTAQLSANYNLYNSTQRLATKAARSALDAARGDLVRQQQQLVVNVSNAFYSLAALHGSVALDENDLAYQKTLLTNAIASERVGRSAGVDVLRARVAVARSGAALVAARTDEENARESLAVEIGAPTTIAFDVPSTLPEPALPTLPSSTLIALARTNRPEIATARANYDAARIADAQADDDLKPTVAANASFGSQVSPTSFVLQQQQIDASNAQALANYQAQQVLFPNVPLAPPVLLAPVDRHQPGFWQFNIVSTFTVPLYDYGVRAAAHHAARAQIESAAAALANAIDSVTADVDAAHRNLLGANDRLALSKLAADEGRETARIAELQFKSGLISFSDVTQTEQTALAAENDLLAARVAYISAFIRLRESLAPPDPAAGADLRGLS